MIQFRTVAAEWHLFDEKLNEILKDLQKEGKKIVSIKFIDRHHAKVIYADKDDDVSDYIGD